MKNIRSVLYKDPELIVPESIRGYAFELLKLSLEVGGLDNFVMTTSNVYFTDDMENLILNHNSFVGLKFFCLEDEDVVIPRN